MPQEELLFRDGLGDRLLIRDTHGRPVHESLAVRQDLSAIPAFEFALNERLWLLERFDHPTFLLVRNIVSLPGRLPCISLISDYTGGLRLSEVLARAESSGQPVSAGAAAFVIKEILDGVAELHRQSGDLSHGALAPERIVLADGRVRIADHVLGPAIEQLRFSTERYWKELRVAVPLSAGGVRLDQRVDIAQIGMIAVALFTGRPLRDSEHIGGLGELLTSISIAAPIRSWLLKALHIDQRRVFVNAAEALQGFNEALTTAGLRPAPRDLNLEPGRVVAKRRGIAIQGTRQAGGSSCARSEAGGTRRQATYQAQASSLEGARLESAHVRSERNDVRPEAYAFGLQEVSAVGRSGNPDDGDFCGGAVYSRSGLAVFADRDARHRVEPARRAGAGQRQGAGRDTADPQG